jgi:uncharacterized protein DUF1579
MPTPVPELGRLDYFAGTWLLVGEMNATPPSPAGKLTETNRNQWMAGGFFLIVHSEFTAPMGIGTGIAYMGYDPNRKIYTYDEFNSMGDAIHSKGKVEGNTWIWSGERESEAKITKTRWIVSIVSPASYDFKFEISKDAAIWETVIAGKATRQT